MANDRKRIASAIVFCPQNRPPKLEYLKRLRDQLCNNSLLVPFVQGILDLPMTWDLYARSNSDIAALSQGPQHIRQLRDWIVDNNAAPLTETMSGILLLPLLTIIHITQYFQYLASIDMRHAQFLDEIRSGGAQGLCGGLLAATAIASSCNESELVQNACKSLRLALCIGACGELGDDPQDLGASTVVLRTHRVGQGNEMVAKFPRTYVATVADPYSISVVGPVQQLAKLQAYAQSQGVTTTELHLRGKVHNPENRDLCQALWDLCSRTVELQLPSAESLQIPVRSNKTGDVLCSGSLSHEVLESALVQRCEWYSVVTALAEDLSNTGEPTHKIIMFGTGRKNCLASEQFEKRGLRVAKIDAVAEVDAMRPRYKEEAIAVVGASCRLPGASNLDEYWNILATGQDRHVELSSNRFDLQGGHRASLCPEYSNNRKFYANLLEHVDQFDHKFFGMSAREAINTDPQQRILLELAYEAMESSGYMRTHDRARGDNVGVFIGASFVEYLDNTNASAPSAYTSTGTIRAFLCGRLSHYFGWSGPAEVIDTACSSSLVAINRAVRAIQNGECSSALAGGINIITGQNNFLDLGKAGFLSPTGQCKPFDQHADGYCRAEGGGLVFLKALPSAQHEKDCIMAVIPATGTNQGGLSRALTIPDSTALSTLYRSVLTQASFEPDVVTYVEAHGTGTQAGDPVEVASIRDVFGNAQRPQKLHLASVKGNIGHCETAAGVAGLLKVICMLDKGKIPPQANHVTWNAKIPALQPDRMCVPKASEPWNVPFQAALVNSYGAAGSNAALLCCEPPCVRRPIKSGALHDTSFPILLSAETECSLRSYQVSLARFLEQTAHPPSILEIAYTLAERRQRHQYSTIIEAISTENLIASLKHDEHEVFQRSKSPDNIVLLLGGQHKRSIGLAKQLYDRYPHFRSLLDQCNAVVQDLGSGSIIPAVFEANDISDIVVLQAGLVAVEYALAMSWIHAGLKVSAIVGHSLGELAGLAVSGMLSLRDCLKLVIARASLIQTKWGDDRGSMLAVSASREALHELLKDSNLPIDIACYNSPTSQVVAGETQAIAAFQIYLQAQVPPVKYKRVHTTHAFHSRLTTPILEDLDRISRSLDWCAPTLPITLCSDRTRPNSSSYSPSAHAQGAVFFEDAVKQVEAELGKSTWIEIGVNSPVVAMSSRVLDQSMNHSSYAMTMANEFASPTSDAVSKTISELWRNSIDVSHWSFLHTSSAASAVWLPPYQFDPTPAWLENIDHAAGLQKQLMASAANSCRPAENTLVKTQLIVPLPEAVGQSSARKRFRVSSHSERYRAIVSGHAVRKAPLCPASVYLECAAMAIALVTPLDPAERLQFGSLDLQAPLGLSCEDIEVSIEPTPAKEKTWDFTMSSINPKFPGKRNIHAQGIVSFASGSNLAAMERLVQRRMHEFTSRGAAESLLTKRAYGLFSRVVNYHDFLRGITSISIDGSEAVAKIVLPTNQPEQEGSSAVSFCEAVVMDNFIQVVGLLMNTSDLVGANEVMVCTGIESGATSEKCVMLSPGPWTVHAAYTAVGSSKAIGDVFVFAEDGSLVAAFTGCQFTKLDISRLERALASVNDGSSSKISNNNTRTNTAGASPKETPASRRPQLLSLDSMPPLSIGSDTSSSVPSSPPSPKQDSSMDEMLFALLADTAGTAASNIKSSMSLDDLGIDSLALIEMCTALSKTVKQSVEPDDITSDMTVAQLLQRFASETDNRLDAATARYPPPRVTQIRLNDDSQLSATKPWSGTRDARTAFSLDMSPALEACALVSRDAAEACGFKHYWSAVGPHQDRLTITYIYEAFLKLGINLPTLPHGALMPDIPHSPTYTKLAQRLCQILSEHDVVKQRADGRYVISTVASTIVHESSKELHKAFVQKYPEYEGEACLMQLTGPKLAECLTGEANPVKLLFGNETSNKFLEDYYGRSPMLSWMTSQLVTFLTALLDSGRNQSSEPYRILEVGAGTGGTTGAVVDMLRSKGFNVAYTFTDISATLVSKAKRRFSQHSEWMSFERLDLERSVPAHFKGNFDIVFATNCVHATKNRAETCARIRETLTAKGFMVLSEVTRAIAWYDIVFGLLDGWWLSEDLNAYPLQPVENWIADLKRAGFPSAAFTSGPTEDLDTQRLLIGSNSVPMVL
ncbi:hypothetical protein LTR37_008375 [Vermiconidia calcicola]|uniref:Uncharacterized protein n=1 Tax=Vermiconidia calcicola TaxID=1690605 RepID=A0ACC3NCM2_9PEZI|nr:hypothetical protein LTR37_008375 [Vermiconidia calcicola]